MRVIVACPKCRRQYDASAQTVGSLFRCHCGEQLAVQAPQGHDAAVVRCSSCGAPRANDAMACDHCGADFTIHEKDLDTVCPGCLALVSDRAKFCHHCGLAIEPQEAAGSVTELICPECEEDHRLVSRLLGREKVSAMECPRCAGLWLGHVTFERLVDRTTHERVAVAAAFVADTPRSTLPEMHDETEWRYRSCPVCRQRMPRRNYGHLSGVIVDVCRGHGVWFDANELPRILDWVRQGGLDCTRQRQSEQLKAEERLRDISRIDTLGMPPGARERVESADRVAEMFAAIGRIFRY